MYPSPRLPLCPASEFPQLIIMGGCASRPRNSNPEVMPAEIPAVQDQSGADPPKQVVAGEAGNAEPLVDLSTPKADAPTVVTARDPFGTVSSDEDLLGAPTTEAVAEPVLVSRSVAADAQAAEVKNVTEEAKVKEEKARGKPEIVEVTVTTKAVTDAPKSVQPETKVIPAVAAISA